MSKRKFFVLFVILLGAIGNIKAQKLIPVEVSVHSFSGIYSIKGVGMKEMLTITPDFNWIKDMHLPKEYYAFDKNYYESGEYLQLGFRLNANEKKKATQLNLGFGKTSGFGIVASYNYENWTAVDNITRQGKTYVLDSFSEVSSRMSYLSTSIVNLRFGLERDFIHYKRLSFRAGINTQVSIFSSSTSSFNAMQFFSYHIDQRYTEVQVMKGDRLYSGSKEEEDPFAFSVMLPFSMSYQLSKQRYFFKNTSLVFGTTVGQRYYFHPEIPSFKAQFARYSIGLRYSFQ